MPSMPLSHEASETGVSLPHTNTGSHRSNAGFSERWRFCVMIFAGSGKYNDHMRQLAIRLKRCALPVESIDTKHGLVEVVVNGSLYDLNDVFFRIGHEFDGIVHP